MTKEELKAYLKDNLQVEVIDHYEYNGRFKEGHGLQVVLLLENEIISSDWFTLSMLDNYGKE